MLAMILKFQSYDLKIKVSIPVSTSFFDRFTTVKFSEGINV